jgi:hypothetical protein
VGTRIDTRGTPGSPSGRVMAVMERSGYEHVPENVLQFNY